MKKSVTILILILISTLSVFSQNKLTVDQVVDKAIAAIANSRGLTAGFSYSTGSATGKGTIKTSGNKFAVTMPDMQVWFNGKDMYSYNKRTSETSLMTPTAQEIAEANPLLYVKASKGGYSAAFSGEKKSGKYVIDLIPKKKTDQMKKVTITLNSSNFLPEKIIAYPRSGVATTITITQMKTGVAVAASEFEYPKSKLPKVQIIDLR